MEVKLVEIVMKREGVLHGYEYEKEYPWYDHEDDWNDNEAERLGREALYHFFDDHEYGFSKESTDLIFKNRKQCSWLGSDELYAPLQSYYDEYVKDDYKDVTIVSITIYHSGGTYSDDPAEDQSWEETL